MLRGAMQIPQNKQGAGPLPLKSGEWIEMSIPSVCMSVCLSIRLPVSPFSVRPLGFPDFSRSSFLDIDLKFDIQVCICHDKRQIKFEFRHAWPTFTRVIALS